jgi:serine protease Do
MNQARFPFALLAVLVIGIALGRALSGPTTASTPPSAEPQPALTVNASLPTVQARPLELATGGIPEVAEGVLPSVVSIFTVQGASSPWGAVARRPSGQQGQGLGSGVVVSEDGVILTNNHVVASADRIFVRLQDGRTLEATLVGRDELSDLAAVRLRDPIEGLRSVPWGDSDALRLGELVLAVGNPFGLSGSVTMGIVSAKGRGDVGIVDYEDFIQTDAAINPGNSGGALVNARGELVGINTAILSQSGGYQGVGFAIPSNMVRPIADSLLETGKVERGFLGVRLSKLEPGALPDSLPAETRGALVAATIARSPAELAGLRPGDVIVGLDSKPVESVTRLRNLIAVQGMGAEVDLQILRGGEVQTIPVKLDPLPSGPLRARR